MAKIDAGQAIFTLKAKDETDQTLDKTESKLKRLGKRFKSVGSGMVTMGKVGARAMVGVAGAAAAAGGAVVAVGKSWANEADRLAKASRVLGVNIEALQELEYAARANGVSAQQMGNMMARSYRRMANAGKEGGPALRAMKELGINADELSKKSPEEAFYGLLDALSSVEDEAFRNQLAFETLGDEWKVMAPFLDGGTKSLDEARAKFHELNLGMSEAEVLAGEEMAQAFSDLGDATSKMKNTVGAAVAGPLTNFLTWLTKSVGRLNAFIKAMGGWREAFRKTFEVGVASTAVAVMTVWNKMVTFMEDVWVGFFYRIRQGLDKMAALAARFGFDGMSKKLSKWAAGVDVEGRAGKANRGRQTRQDAIDLLRRDLGKKTQKVAEAVKKSGMKLSPSRTQEEYNTGKRERTYDMAGPQLARLLAAQSTILSGFALGGVGAVMGGISNDPKKEEKEANKLLGDINRKMDNINKTT